VPPEQISTFSIPPFNGHRVLVEGLAAGSDGNLWSAKETSPASPG
jgi:hypothetical protein